MGGIYISGMEMPTAGMCKTITIFDDGAVVKGNGSEKLGIAVPVPPHGRMIDADYAMNNMHSEHPYVQNAIRATISAAPTIIPAEGK